MRKVGLGEGGGFSPTKNKSKSSERAGLFMWRPQTLCPPNTARNLIGVAKSLASLGMTGAALTRRHAIRLSTPPRRKSGRRSAVFVGVFGRAEFDSDHTRPLLSAQIVELPRS